MSAPVLIPVTDPSTRAPLGMNAYRSDKTVVQMIAEEAQEGASHLTAGAIVANKAQGAVQLLDEKVAIAEKRASA